jgi:hypothetical protein
VVDGGYHQRYATTPSSCWDYDWYRDKEGMRELDSGAHGDRAW